MMEFDCYIDEVNDVVGVYVCRGGKTTCSLEADLLASDTCGCCAGDNRLGCQDDGDLDWTEAANSGSTTTAAETTQTGTTTATVTVGSGSPSAGGVQGSGSTAAGAAGASVCSAFQMMEFDCYINAVNDIVGVFVCRNGKTTCALEADLLASDKCGCCAGDNRLECQDDVDMWEGEAAMMMNGNSKEEIATRVVSELM